MNRLFILGLMCLLLFSCKNDITTDDIIVNSHRLSFLTYKFEKDKNPSLNKDVILTIGESDTLYAFIPELKNCDSLISTFEIDSNLIEKVTVGGGNTEVRQDC